MPCWIRSFQGFQQLHGRQDQGRRAAGALRTHGLRKAAARRLAEAGCSANEIASITGHVKLDEVARYTKAAEQEKLARAAIDRLPGGQKASGFPNGATSHELMSDLWMADDQRSVALH